MGDFVRYTAMTNHNNIAKTAIRTVKQFEKAGYIVTEIDNKYLDKGSVYKGVHLSAISGDGQKIEYQIRSRESIDCKNKLHPLYEEWRNVNTSQDRRNELKTLMRSISASLPIPNGIEKLKNRGR